MNRPDANDELSAIQRYLDTYEYQTEFARRYAAYGRIALIELQLRARFGPLPPAARARIASATIDGLDAIGVRLLTARSLEEAVG
jgi:hypothetical protein